MRKKDFKQRVLEQQIFDELKDTSIKNGKYFREKYNGSDIDFSRLYRRIINYQIKEYGYTLNDYEPRKTREERLKQAQNKRQRRYHRRICYEKNID